jgi:NADH-quinone oxidoreductase subunit M
MILVVMILVLLAGACLAWALAPLGDRWPRWISIAALAIDFVLALSLWSGSSGLDPGAWKAEIVIPWFPTIGVGIHLAADGLSLLLVLLTCVLGILSVGCSWREITSRVGFFHFNLMLVLVGVMGVFLSLDLFLFYFFWELMLVPLYFLIAIWGHENRIYASIKFFLFTQASGLLMLISIIGLAFAHYRASGELTFDAVLLLGTPMTPEAAMWLMLGFIAAFFVKIPSVPLHTWLPDAHTEAPTAGSVILAGLLLKTGAYGVLRFAVPLFPEAARSFAPVAMALGAAGVLYGAVLAFSQTDLKRLVAYTSVSHMGFVIIGIYAGTTMAQQGAVLEMLAHGLSTGGLFIMVGALSDRIHTRDMNRMGGLWTVMPRMGGVAMVLAMASLGLPGLANFVAEYLVLNGSYVSHPAVAVVAAVGLVFAMVYSLWIMQRVFQGTNERDLRPPDLSKREGLIFAVLIAGLVGLGLYPQPVLDSARPALAFLQQAASGFGR